MSALALLKIAMHARSGGSLEVRRGSNRSSSGSSSSKWEREQQQQQPPPEQQRSARMHVRACMHACHSCRADDAALPARCVR